VDSPSPTPWVGTCVAGTHYTTIQAAINAATSPSTVQICPGTYQEQVEIKSALTLKGVTQGPSNSVVIRPPAMGLASNSLSGLFGKLFVNVYVHANAAVTISNITIDDGGGTACPATGYRVGLLYQGGGGSVTNSAFVDSPTCAKSIAAMADVTSGFTFTNNVDSPARPIHNAGNGNGNPGLLAADTCRIRA
jgi:pectin methylesterase-like acyl-CoA thioesterase